jgi:endoglucanase
VRKTVWWLSGVLALCGTAASQVPSQRSQNPSAHQSANGLAFRRAQHLRHGINASEWFAQRPSYPRVSLETYTTPDDIHLMRRLSFDHVRLSIDPAPLACLERTEVTSCYYLEMLDRTIDAILNDGMSVIVDVHPSSEFKHALAGDSAAVTRFADLWRKIAAHYSTRDPEWVFFEVLNEPEFNDRRQWDGVQQQLVGAIRATAPQNTIIVAGAHWSSLEDMLTMQPLADQNLIYNFHDYSPHIFTHQGATWGEAEWANLRGLPYPSTPDAVAPTAKSIQDPLVRLHVNEYGFDSWDARHIASQIEIAADWGRAHHVPVTCNEFGVYRPYIDPKSRSAWIEDMRRALESNGIGWTMWDYRGGFGVVQKPDVNLPAKPDESIVHALGLAGQ